MKEIKNAFPYFAFTVLVMKVLEQLTLFVLCWIDDCTENISQ